MPQTEVSGGTNASAAEENAGPVRVRFAPSPTGIQHIGGYRTCIFIWLFARRYGGQFLLRIEDTDTGRSVPEAVDALLDGLRWLDVLPDEGPIVGGPYGPYYQTQRAALYHYYADELIKRGGAYRCYCTPERLDAMRKEQEARGIQSVRYDRRCRYLTPEERKAHEDAGESFVVRLAVPLEGKTVVKDLLRGDVIFDNDQLQDTILLKSNGLPTYHLANVIDDHLMRISHVTRGANDWLPSAPYHVLTYQFFGWEQPIWVHMPVVLGKDRKKLSKRHGAEPLSYYQEQGYLPEAIINYLALLGWSYDDKTDILSREQLMASFSLDRLSISDAMFDSERLLWMNGYYIRLLSPEELAERTIPFLERAEGAGGLPGNVARPLDKAYVARVLKLEQERMKTLGEAAQLVPFFFTDDLHYQAEALIGKGMDREKARTGLQRALALLESLPTWEASTMEEPMRALADELGLKPGQLFMSARVAISGRTVSPPLFETMEVLGRERTLARLRQALAKL
ncbi:MAG TPA: glutamate--tRNA ligase [Ktedonobacterales bacterium]|nr:glutamate--tRNA ligase [Ktedonobacterales bacterium]